MTDEVLAKKAADGAVWLSLDSWINRLVGLVVLAMLGRLLSPEDFGTVAIATGFIAFANIFVDQGFSRILIRRLNLDAVITNTAFWTSFSCSGALAVAVFLTAPHSAALFGGQDSLVQVIRVMAIGLLVSGLSSVPAALLEREFKFKALAVRRITATVVGGAAATFAAAAGFGVWSLVVQTLMASLVGLILLWSASRWRPRARWSTSSLRLLWREGSSIIGIEIVGLLNSQADRLLIGAFLGPEALGYYFLAMRLTSILVEVSSALFSGASLATFSRLQGDRPRLLDWFNRLVNLSSTSAIPLFAVLFVTAPVVIPLFFGEQWEKSAVVVQILCFLGALNVIAYFDRSVLIAVGSARAAFLLTLVQSVSGILLEVAALPFGVVAVAVAVVARQYVFWPVRAVVLKKLIGLAPCWYALQWLRPAVIAVVGVGLAWAISLAVPQVHASALLSAGLALVVVASVFAGGTLLFNRSYVRDIRRALILRRG